MTQIIIIFFAFYSVGALLFFAWFTAHGLCKDTVGDGVIARFAIAWPIVWPIAFLVVLCDTAFWFYKNFIAEPVVEETHGH